MTEGTLILDSADVRAVVADAGVDALMDEMIAALTAGIRSYDDAAAQVPPRNGVFYEQPEWGLLECMPAHLGEGGTTVKLVGYHPANPSRYGLPTVVSTICVFDSATGHLSGLLDGTFLTALRTGAASAVASRLLARPDSAVAGVIGCGAQAVTQVHALTRCFPLKKVMAVDIDMKAANSLQQRLAFAGVEVEVMRPTQIGALVEASDLLVTCTSAAPGEGPVFADGPHQPHLHINAVGSDFPGKFEVPVELLRRSLVCPDFRGQAVAEGECQQLGEEEIGPDLLTLVRNAADYEEAREEPTVFDSTGWALEDQVAARLMLERARAMGLGSRVAVECLSADPLNPYSVTEHDGQPVHDGVAARRLSR